MGIMRFDINQFLTTAAKRGQTILLLGAAGDGPVNTPTSVSSPTQFAAIFGDMSKGDLGKAFMEVYRTNSNLDINLMRISGSQSSAAFQTASGIVLSVQSKSGGEKYNHISIDFRTISSSQGAPRNAMIVTMADKANVPQNRMIYYLDQYDYVNDLVRTINADARKNVIPITASTAFPFETSIRLWTSNINTSTKLSGGTDGLPLSKNDRYLALDASYGLLEGFYIDIIVPVNAFLDDTHPVAFYGSGVYGTSYYASKRDYLSLMDSRNQDQIVSFHEQLISFCSRQQGLGIFTHGVVGMNPVDDPSMIDRYPYSFTDKLVRASAFKDRHGLSVTSNGQMEDRGSFISVVAGEYIYAKGTTDEYFNNFYLVYAAMVAGIFKQLTTTNQPVTIPNISLRYEFSTEEIEDMADLGVVTFRKSVRRGIVVCNGVTAALPTSDMHYVSNMRMLQLTMSLIDFAIQDLVGLNLQPVVMSQELERVVNDLLAYLASADVGVLKGYSFNTTWDAATQQGYVQLKLMARYAFEFTGSRVNFSSKG